MIGKRIQKGFALYLTVIAVGIVSFITIALADIAFRQNIIATIGNRSQQAFYASDSGIECALFFDLHHAVFPTRTSDPFSPELIDCGEGYSEAEVIESSSDHAISSVVLGFEDINCDVRITVEKNRIPGRIITKIISEGESGSCVSGTQNRFQRSIEVNY